MHKISNWVVCVNGNHPRAYMKGSVIFRLVSLGGVYWENSHRRESHTGMTFWFCIAFTWWLGHFISRYLKVHFMLIKYMCDSKLQTLHMRYPFQSTGRPISHRNGWSFRVYMIPLRDFVPEWNSRPGTRTGVNSRRGDSRRHDILWWYHVNKYRATRGNRSELALGQKSPPCHVNSPLVGTPMVYQFLLLCVNPHQQKLISQWPSTKFIHLEDV